MLKHTHYEGTILQRYPILKDYSVDISNYHPLGYRWLFGI